MPQQMTIEIEPEKPPVYLDLEKICLPLIEAFHDDLIKHDLRDIREHPGVPFLHFTGSTGTYLERLDPPEWYPAKGERVPYLFSTAERRQILNGKVITVEYMEKCNRMGMILYCDGRNLREIPYERAKGIIRKYQHRIQKHWRKEG